MMKIVEIKEQDEDAIDFEKMIDDCITLLAYQFNKPKKDIRRFLNEDR